MATIIRSKVGPLGPGTPIRPPMEEIPPPADESGGGRTPVMRVTAVVPPHRLDAVHGAALDQGVPGVTVTDVQGFGRQRGHRTTYRGAEYDLEFVPKVRIDILVHHAAVQPLVDALVGAARSGQIGDGKVWVSPVESVTRIRTGEVGPDAL